MAGGENCELVKNLFWLLTLTDFTENLKYKHQIRDFAIDIGQNWYRISVF